LLEQLLVKYEALTQELAKKEERTATGKQKRKDQKEQHRQVLMMLARIFATLSKSMSKRVNQVS